MSIASEWQALRADVKRQKAAIYQHRRALQTAAAALATFEARCRQLGIGLVLDTHRVGDDLHGDPGDRLDPQEAPAQPRHAHRA